LSVVGPDASLDAGNVAVMQGHYVGKGKATGRTARAAVAHVFEISDGKIVRFDQYVDSATMNPIIGAQSGRSNRSSKQPSSGRLKRPTSTSQNASAGLGRPT
jgi:hypothetical protein